jgi:arylamine N-acetyltransferase
MCQVGITVHEQRKQKRIHIMLSEAMRNREYIIAIGRGILLSVVTIMTTQ